MNQKHIQHLYWRAGFGITPKQIEQLIGKTKTQVVDALFRQSSKTTPLVIDLIELESFSGDRLKKSKSARMDFNKISREKILEFSDAWMQRFSSANELLREKMTLFWANHFVVKEDNAVFVQQYNNVLRQYALGHFGDFVKAVSKEPAMIKYLNTKQNRKQSPNENFARELMELFTLGTGHYTEQDIKQSAKAFTGYNHDFEGDFNLRQRQHDTGFKYFFGKAGKYDGDDIIDIILEQKQCAKFICEKVYKYFVNDRVNSVHIEQMVNQFYPNYNIEKLMRFVFSSDWFYAEEHIGSKIKSPVELIVGINNTVPFKLKNERDSLKIQRVLGQVLLSPPNVAGWKGGRSWIDSNTIMIRLRLASVLLNNAFISSKEDGDFVDAYKQRLLKRNKNKLPFQTDAKWSVFESNFSKTKVNDLKEYIIQQPLNNGTLSYLNSLNKSSKQDVCIQLMSLPEYQMC